VTAAQLRTLLLVGLLTPDARAGAGDAPVTAGYFPLHVGNWWAYEELDEDGNPLARETWTLVERTDPTRAAEFHLRSSAKRLDALGDVRRRWEAHEYLRATGDGVHKRYPAGHDAELDVMLLHEPASPGTQWRDAQGRCEVAAAGDPCPGPRGDLPQCVVVVCRLGDPPATIVTSTYARGVGMVRQDVEVVQLLPALGGATPGMLPSDVSKGGHSVLRLTGYHVSPPAADQAR
jgi:hypothetical protein